MSLIPLGFWAASGAGASAGYWLLSFGGTADDEFGYGVGSDSQGNVYTVGKTQSTGAGSSDILLAKFDSAGSIVWQRILGGTGGDDARAVAFDSSDNVYIVGETASAGAGGDDMVLAKYNPSGVIQFQKTLGGSTTDRGRAVAVDSANNVYMAGSQYNSGAGGAETLVAKFTSAGVIQWQKSLGSASYDVAEGVAFDSSYNVYVVGNGYNTATGIFDILLAKYSNSGSLEWQRFLGIADIGDYDYGLAIAIDGSNNIYIAGHSETNTAGGLDFLLAKYNTSGSLQWQRRLGGSSSDYSNSVAVDSSGNVFIFGYTSSTTKNAFLIAKYDSSGTIQWQRTLESSVAETGMSIKIDKDDAIVVMGTTRSTGPGGRAFLAARLPSDGSLTGTYSLNGVNMVYSASSLAASTSDLTEGPANLTGSTTTLTLSSSSMTAATSTLTAHLVEVS